MEMASSGGDDAAREISLCWLAHALHAAVRRLRDFSLSDGGVAILSVASQARDPTILPTLLAAVARQEIQLDDETSSIYSVRSVENVDAISGVVGGGVTIACVEVDGDVDDSWPRLHQHVAAQEIGQPWICVGYSSCGALAIRLDVYPAEARATLELALSPLRELCQQCGLTLALELVAKLKRPPLPEAPDHPSILSNPTASQLPFQLLLMLLRWSYFHPQVLSLVAKPFLRKLALNPQARARAELVTLYTKSSHLWKEIHADFEYQDPTAQIASPRSPGFQLPNDNESDSDEENDLPPLKRLSQCSLWDKQKQFYRDQGIRAWSNHLIPFGVSSSSFLALQYARLAVDFLVHNCAASSEPAKKPQPRTPNCFVWEAASGSCKFLHSFLLHFYDLFERLQIEQRMGIVPCVLATDLSIQVLTSRAEMTCFQPFLANGRLDFATFDTDTFLHGCDDEKGFLYLRHAKRKWRVGREQGPVFIMGNYFLDSLRTDIFLATKVGQNSTELREAQIDPTTDSIPDMLFSLSRVRSHPCNSPLYATPAVNAALMATLARLEEEWTRDMTISDSGVTRSSLILFPIEAITFFHDILNPSEEIPTFPVAVVTGDATFNFHDPVPSSFIDSETGDLEIPQLSPHPDCFCLPVDLEILELFANTVQASATVISTPSSDTFNLFLVQSSVTSSQDILTRRFHDLFNHFTPCDCDLLWGLISVDAGARHLSVDSQLALVAQTAWDFDVFSAVQWQLSYKYREECKRQADFVDGGDSAQRSKLERFKNQLTEAGRRSLKTLYVLDENSRIATKALTLLQVARWFYVLGALSEAKSILGYLAHEHPGLKDAVSYINGRLAYQMNDFWTALAYFRTALQTDPTRLRLKKWVARTLVRLQEAKLQLEQS